eukprot:TRINITY_DN664_c0_g1_i12.p1 TRINITY_DN664_c0_g1~~TRINITY_DN664_c0_g1_i12.p1  ORF type:complete len:239 (+),score=40.09 TRINITY_DN664_c0_g1_i12:436-1152(+)
MSKGNSLERVLHMQALGAEVVLVDQLPDSKLGQVSGGDLGVVEREMERIAAERGAFKALQFERQANFNAHFLGTGPELWEQSGGRIDAFVDFVGTGGTFAGVAAALKARNPSIECFVLEPDSAAVLAGRPKQAGGAHKIQGGGYARGNLPLMRMAEQHGVRARHIQISDNEAITGARLLAATEGIFGGFSAGANAYAAGKLLSGLYAGQPVSIVAIVCDTGLKYLSTDLWLQSARSLM